jgi:hypothetical protein
MLGVPIDGPALLLGDNTSVVLNTAAPPSILKKKHHTCAYHHVCEAIAGGIMNFVHISLGSPTMQMFSANPYQMIPSMVSSSLYCSVYIRQEERLRTNHLSLYALPVITL